MTCTLILLFLCQLSSFSFAVDDILENAGLNYGYEIWRIDDSENTNPQFIHLPEEGFEEDDIYLVLMFTKAGKTELHGWNLHFWIGSNVSEEKIDITVHYLARLSNKFGSDMVLYREVQGYESSMFKSYFPELYPPSTYDLEEVKTLYVVKGNIVVQPCQVPLRIEWLNTDDCFVLDLGSLSDVFLYYGYNAGEHEKISANLFAQKILDERHFGRYGKIRTINTFYQASENVQDFLEALGETVDDRWKIRDSSYQTAEEFETEYINNIQLFVIFNDNDATEIVEDTRRPIDLFSFQEECCFVVDTHTETIGIMVMFGHTARLEEKQAALMKAEELRRSKNYQLWHPVKITNTVETFVY